MARVSWISHLVLLLVLLQLLPTPTTASPWSITHYPTKGGTFDLTFNGQTILKNGCPSIQPKKTICQSKSINSTLSPVPTRGHDSKLGNYTQNVITWESNSPTFIIVLLEIISFDAAPVVHLNLQFPNGIDTNFVSPLYEAAWSIGAGLMTRVLDVPMDNDVQSFYLSLSPFITSGTSMFVTSFYDEKSKKGLVLGFLNNNEFKNGIEYGPLHVNCVSGINGEIITRDVNTHGIVYNMIHAPTLSIGMYSDWRDGMEKYAAMQKENNGMPAPLPTNYLNNQPYGGWNSWAMSAAGIGQPNASIMNAAIDTMHSLQSNQSNQSNNAFTNQYITRDAVYGMNTTATAQWVDKAYQNGQGVGTYDSPVIYWHGKDDPIQTISCNNGPETCNVSTNSTCWYVNDVVVKDKNGNWIRDAFARIENGPQHVRDVTHPSWKCMMERNIHRQINVYKYNLLKEDFLNLAAYEAHKYYNTSIATTGMMAYHYALTVIATLVNGRAMIDYGISLPLPVGPAGHSRHSGCEQM
jgi:alpha-galactosidase